MVDMSVLQKLDPEPEIPSIPLYPKPVEGIEAPDKEAKLFPLQLKSRSESSDPNLPASPAAVLPAKKPAEEELKIVSNNIKKPPLPPRRPGIQNASRSFVKNARRKFVNQGPKVTAMPAEPVSSVPLQPPQEEYNIPIVGNVIKQIESIDKNKLVETVQAIMAAQTRQAKAPGQSKQAAVSGIDVPIPQKKPFRKTAESVQAASLSAAKENKVMHDITANHDIAERLARIEPAAIDITADMNRRPVFSPKNLEKNSLAAGPYTNHAEKKLVLPIRKGHEQFSRDALQSVRDDILQTLGQHPRWRLQIHAYAAGDDDREQGARRLALSRALHLRSYLLEQGIEPSRLDIRALGKKDGTTPLDRTELIFVDPQK